MSSTQRVYLPELTEIEIAELRQHIVYQLVLDIHLPVMRIGENWSNPNFVVLICAATNSIH